MSIHLFFLSYNCNTKLYYKDYLLWTKKCIASSNCSRHFVYRDYFIELQVLKFYTPLEKYTKYCCLFVEITSFMLRVFTIIALDMLQITISARWASEQKQTIASTASRVWQRLPIELKTSAVCIFLNFLTCFSTQRWLNCRFHLTIRLTNNISVITCCERQG